MCHRNDHASNLLRTCLHNQDADDSPRWCIRMIAWHAGGFDTLLLHVLVLCNHKLPGTLSHHDIDHAPQQLSA